MPLLNRSHPLVPSRLSSPWHLYCSRSRVLPWTQLLPLVLLLRLHPYCWQTLVFLSPPLILLDRLPRSYPSLPSLPWVRLIPSAQTVRLPRCCLQIRVLLWVP